MTSKEKGRIWVNNKNWQETGYFRPTALIFAETQDIKLRYGKGETFAQIALTYGIAPADIRRALGLEVRGEIVESGAYLRREEVFPSVRIEAFL
jgi:hypothetical protein